MIGATLHSRYWLEAELGRGGMGVVYRAQDILLNRVIAVKLLSNAGLGTAGKVRLLAEARAAAKLNHPNIVAVHDAGEVDDNPFIVMELVAGESLRHFQPSSLDDTLNITRQICLALEHAHANGIIHRDLKPDNIVLTPERIAKLMDFGLALTVDAPRLTEEGTLMGTFAYMAPELVQGQPASVQSDLYALGVMLYEWLAGRPPFSGENVMALMMQHLNAPVVPPSQHQPTVPASLDLLVVQLLSKQPEARPSSATAVRDVIDRLPGIAVRPLSTWQPTRHNLPRQLTSFVGREKEIAHLQKQLLNPANRLVTLTGPGGTGKTRLSLEAAGTLLDAFADGIWLVELAPLADPALVVNTVATVFELREEGERPLATALANYLQNKHLLLILDNCEHLIETCARLAQSWLESCPHLTLLASSREALGVPGEIAVRIPPLAVPAPEQAIPLAALAEIEAVRLFVERARAALSSFELTGRNGAAVSQICQRLDGIPLALELAAARVKVLQVEQIAQRLDDLFRLLTGGSRTALPRQQTLLATIDWSYDLLPEAEQRLLQRLSVFAGGWTLEAAEAVCADGQISGFEILDLLTQLVNKSLVSAERKSGQETRYGLLETIRQYAQEKLLQAGHGELFRRRHLDYFLQLAETAEPELYRDNQLLWLDRLDTEHDNLRAALGWAQETEVDKGLRLALALDRFWGTRGYEREAEGWLARLLVEPKILSANLRARGITAQSELHTAMFDLLRAIELAEESLSICRELGDQRGTAINLAVIARTRSMMGEEQLAQITIKQSLEIYKGLDDKSGLAPVLEAAAFLAGNSNNFDLAMSYLAESEKLQRKAGDQMGIAYDLGRLGQYAFYQGDFATARTKLEESLAIQEPFGEQGTRLTLYYLGELALRQREYEQARLYFEKSYSLCLESGNTTHSYWSYVCLGYVFLRMGLEAQARMIFAESQRQFREVDSPIGVVFTLEGLASLAVAQEQFQKAAQLFAWADAKREEILDIRPPSEQAEVDQDIAASIAAIGEEAFAAASMEGKKLTMEQAVALALAE